MKEQEPSVLVVHNNPDIASLYKDILEIYSLSMREYNWEADGLNLEKFIKHMQDTIPDIVMIDLPAFYSTLRESLKRLTDDPELSRIHFLFLARDDRLREDIARHWYRQGVVYVQKPFDVTELGTLLVNTVNELKHQKEE